LDTVELGDDGDLGVTVALLWALDAVGDGTGLDDGDGTFSDGDIVPAIGD